MKAQNPPNIIKPPMIENDKQLEVTKNWIKEFQEAVDSFDKNDFTDVHPDIKEAERNALNHQLQKLKKEVEEYENRNVPRETIN